MKPILFVTDANFLSHLLRCLEIAKVLRSRGETVIFAASGIYEKILADNGFERYPVYTNCPVHTMKVTRASMFRYYNGNRLRQSVDSEIECIRKINPRVAVGDFRWTLRISTEYCKVPYVGIINTMWTKHYAEKRSISEKMLLGKLFGKRFMEWASPYGQKLMMFDRGVYFWLLRKKLGLHPISDLNHEMYGEFNLMPDIPEFCPTNDLPENFHYIGPLFARSDRAEDLQKYKLPDEPYIYVTLGSTATPKMIQLAMDAFATIRTPVVMTTGGQHMPDSIPSNFMLFDYLPSNAAYKNAQAVVCHGGQGTLYQALSYGVPIIGIATHNDQQWNMDRITALNFGIQFGEDSCVPGDILAAYTTILNDPSYAQACEQIQKTLAAYDAPRMAAELIVEYADKADCAQA
ncbi:MAG: nucleotide disphospho-sugar-binding domain-containing protein [Candidatus Auribacterota bacterium]